MEQRAIETGFLAILTLDGIFTKTLTDPLVGGRLARIAQGYRLIEMDGQDLKITNVEVVRTANVDGKDIACEVCHITAEGDIQGTVDETLLAGLIKAGWTVAKKSMERALKRYPDLAGALRRSEAETQQHLFGELLEPPTATRELSAAASAEG
jgi:hypothetical protein